MKFYLLKGKLALVVQSECIVQRCGKDERKMEVPEINMLSNMVKFSICSSIRRL